MHLPLGFMVHRAPLSLRQIDRYLRRTAPWEVEIIVLTCADRLATGRARIGVDPPPPRPGPRGDGRPLRPERPRPGGAAARRRRGGGGPGPPPGPWLAELLDQLREEQVVGAVRTRDEALRFAGRWAASYSAEGGPRLEGMAVGSTSTDCLKNRKGAL